MRKLKFHLKIITTYLINPILCLLYCVNVTSQENAKPIIWKQVLNQDTAWYSSEEAIRIADNVIVYQHTNGGWPKNQDMAKSIGKKQLYTIQQGQEDNSSEFSHTTIDNNATYTQMRYLAMVYNKTGLERFKASYIKGLDYLLEAQYENGGWPQFYPIRKGYYEHITFNDGAMIGVMSILQDITKGEFSFVNDNRILKAQQAIDKGLEIILKTQVVVDGKLTAWCAQYDHKNLQPAKARSYELVSISGAESVGVLKYLMGIEEPNTAIKKSINSAMAWFDRVKITGIRLIKEEDASLPKGYDLIVGFDPLSSTPYWARFYEINTFYPMFCDRDGIVKYALSEIGYERRNGYRWLGDWASKLITVDYPAWVNTWETKTK